jgi:methyl-accepting chemotaxis protein
MIDVLKRQGEGIVSYTFPKAGQTEPLPKMTYVKLFEPWSAFIGTGVYTDDIDAAVWRIIAKFAVVVGIASLLAGAVAFALGSNITRGLGGLRRKMAALATGDLAIELDEVARDDEVGEMAAAVLVFKENAIEKRRLEQSQSDEQAVRSRRQEEVDQLVGFFGRSIAGVLTSVSTASTNMATTSLALGASTGETGGQARLVMGEIEQTVETIQSVAAAAQELASVTDADLGRFNVTRNPADRHVFKVPSLRNVVLTAPYFHDGYAGTLEEAIALMARYQLGRDMPANDILRIAAFLATLADRPAEASR